MGTRRIVKPNRPLPTQVWRVTGELMWIIIRVLKLSPVDRLLSVKKAVILVL